MAKPPNILFLLSDQQRYDTLGLLNPSIRTPNLDRLAAGGIHGNRCYPPTPVCLPCRASLMTGQYPSRHGAQHNGNMLREDYFPTLPAVLRTRGYYTHMVGKSHLAPCHDYLSKEARPFIHNREYYRKWDGPWYGFEKATINIGHSTEAHGCGMHYGAWLEDKGIDTDRYFGNTPYEGHGSWDLPEEVHNSAWTAEMTLDAMKAAQERGQPFYIWSNFQDPHNPCYVPEPWASMYDPAQIPQFGFKPGEPECYADKPHFYRELLESPGEYTARFNDPELGIPFNTSHWDWDQEEVQKNAAAYYGMVSLMDKYIGKILDGLEEMGLAEETIVVFSSDHGDMLGDHGFWWKGIFPYEESMRVPFLARWPGHIPEGARTEALMNLAQLPGTFCRAAGCELPADMVDKDLMPALTKPGHEVQDYVVVEERPGEGEWAQRILVTKTHKLCFYTHREYGELYDMENDPHQTKNLWEDPGSQTLKHELIRTLFSDEILRARPYPQPNRKNWVYDSMY